VATCVRCNDEFELVAEWHRTFTEATGETVTLVYRSVVCDDCLTEAEAEERGKWSLGDAVDPVLMGLTSDPERRVVGAVP
jgi:hypothetical protein